MDNAQNYDCYINIPSSQSYSWASNYEVLISFIAEYFLVPSHIWKFHH
jgi:hypothetical protein